MKKMNWFMKFVSALLACLVITSHALAVDCLDNGYTTNYYQEGQWATVDLWLPNNQARASAGWMSPDGIPATVTINVLYRSNYLWYALPSRIYHNVTAAGGSVTVGKCSGVTVVRLTAHVSNLTSYSTAYMEYEH